jgi:hypothetical protein
MQPLLQMHQSSTFDKKYSMVIYMDCNIIWVGDMHIPTPKIKEVMAFRR